MSELDRYLDEVLNDYYKKAGIKPKKIVSFEEWEAQQQKIADLQQQLDFKESALNLSMENSRKFSAVVEKLEQENEQLKDALTRIRDIPHADLAKHVARADQIACAALTESELRASEWVW